MQRPLPQLTRRNTWIPRIPGKTLAVIGMRRSGKTSLLWQQVGERLAAGAARAWLPLVSFEDERLLAQSPGVELLDHLLETFFQLQPQLRTGQPRGCLFLDEIQRIPGWEGFVRRVMDTEPIDVVVSGSSAEMLSSEIASSLRGRAVETVVLLELLRQGAEVGYLRTSDGFEVDFHARFPDGRRELIQVCADLSDSATRRRELRALQQALVEPIGAGAQARVISLDRGQPTGEWPETVIWSSALEWLLQA